MEINEPVFASFTYYFNTASLHMCILLCGVLCITDLHSQTSPHPRPYKKSPDFRGLVCNRHSETNCKLIFNIPVLRFFPALFLLQTLLSLIIYIFGDIKLAFLSLLIYIIGDRRC